MPFTTQAALQPGKLRYDALRDPDVLARYRRMGIDPVAPHAPDAFGKLPRSEVDRWGKVIRDAHISVQ